MNRWMLIRKLRGPAFLMMVGVTALLNQWDILSFGRSWPLYLILAGVLRLAERAALSQASMADFDPMSAQPQPPVSQVYGTPGTSLTTTNPPAGQDPEAGRA